jgi:hypothetical protein
MKKGVSYLALGIGLPTETSFAQEKSSMAMLRFVDRALRLTGSMQGQLALLVRFQWVAGQRAAALMSAGPFAAVIALTHRIHAGT